MGRRAVAVTLLLCGLCVGSAGAVPAAVGKVRYFSGLLELPLTEAELRYRSTYTRTHECRVWGLIPRQRDDLAPSIAHLNTLLLDPAFRAVLEAKADWMQAPATAGRDLLQRLLTATAQNVSLFLYERTQKRPCKTTLANGSTHAFTPLPKSAGHGLLFLFAPYFDAARAQPDSEVRTRNLAKTLLHETMHVFGYRHDAPVGSLHYNNTVPAFLGCAVLNWSRDPADQEYVRTQCARPSKQQRPSRFRLRCTGRKATDFHVGDAVTHWWRTHDDRSIRTCGRVTAVDVDSGILYIEYKPGVVDSVDDCIVEAATPAQCPRHAAAAPPR